MAKKIDSDKLAEKKATPNALAAQEALKAGGYIKGYGSQARVMRKDHHPLFNMPHSDLQWMEYHRIVRRENNVWILNELQ